MEINVNFCHSTSSSTPLKFSSRLPIIFLISTKNHPFSIANAIANPLIFLHFLHFPLSQFYPFSPQNPPKTLVTQGFSRYTSIDSPISTCSIIQKLLSHQHFHIFHHLLTITLFPPHDKQKKSRLLPTLL